MSAATVTRVELPRRMPCFHCSKSLQMIRPGVYVGFVVSFDGFERTLHRACVAEFVVGDIAEPVRCADTAL